MTTISLHRIAIASLLALCVNAEDKIPLVLTLPKPVQIGTPVPIKLSNLEANPTGPRAAFLVPKGAVNLAKDKKVTGSDNEPLLGDLSMLTDGEKGGEEGNFVEMDKGKQWIQIDLGASSNLYAIALWHFHSQKRAYKSVAVQLCDDPDFISGVQTIFNNDIDNVHGFGAGKDPAYVETNEGRIIDAKGLKARYVRFYSNGSTSSDKNHYIEAEVFGTP